MSGPTLAARWWRVALQVNPAGYSKKYRGTLGGVDPETHAREMIARAQDLGVEILAITDHHSVADIEIFRDAAKDSGITIFPGFELTTSENVHLLCIFDPSREVGELNRVLGGLGVLDPGADSRPTKLNCLGAMEAIHRQHGGLVIAAHAMNDNGLLRVLEGAACVDAWRSPYLDAIQVPAADSSGLEPKYRRILENRDPNYRRGAPRGTNLALARVLARDVAQPDHLAHASATCWIKMGSPTLEGLRLALLDPDDRISLEEPPAADWPRIEHIAWKGGFLDGASIDLGSNLNVLIGGRGTGKSTVIESLRFALGLEPKDSKDHIERHQRFVKNVLRSGSVVSVRLWVAGVEYDITRTVGEAPITFGEHGKPIDVEPADLIRGVELFSQRELSTMAREPTNQLPLLDRYLQDGAARRRELDDIRYQIGRARDELEAAEKELAKKERAFEEQPRLLEQKRQLEKSGLTDKLEDKRRRDREETCVTTARKRVDSVAEAIDRLAESLPIDRAFAGPAALKDLPNAAVLTRLQGDLKVLESTVQSGLEELRRGIDQAREKVRAVGEECAPRWQKVDTAYQSTLRELQRERFDGSELIQIEKRIGELQAQEPGLEAQRKAVTTRRERIEALLVEWRELLKKRREAYERGAKKVGRSLPGMVRAKVTTDSTRSALMQVIRDHVPGRLDQVERGVQNAPDLDAAQLATLGRQGAAALEQALGCSTNQAERVAEAGEPLWRDLDALEEPLEACIELNIGSASDPTYRRLDELSDGQKATALLLIVLGESSHPLVIDQPEDDLDNKFIVEGIVARLRRAKTERQVIIATHNPNLPVLGDCELLVPMKATVQGGQPVGEVDQEAIGAIDEPHARSRVEELLEGGRRAFETRRERYGY